MDHFTIQKRKCKLIQNSIYQSSNNLNIQFMKLLIHNRLKLFSMENYFLGSKSKTFRGRKMGHRTSVDI